MHTSPSAPTRTPTATFTPGPVDDFTLLHRYAETHAEDAFAALVQRHLDFVYAAALRQVNGDAHLAHDVAQTVFADLARRAAHVRAPVLAGWLHTSTHHAAAHAVRAAQRQRAREQLAHAMHDQLHDPARDAEWAQVRPLLDAALHELPATDRDALLLRFFEARSFAAIGTALRLTENAARMRVERALDRLRTRLARRGLASSAAVLATALTSYAASSAAPAGLATTITSGALASATATAGAAAAGTFTFMGLTKLQTLAASALAIAGGTILAVQKHEQTQLRATLAAATAPLEAPTPVRPATPAASPGSPTPDAATVRPAATLPADTATRAPVDRRPDRVQLSTHLVNDAAPPAPADPAAAVPPPQPPPPGLDTQPKLVRQPSPSYPFEMRALGLPGEATVNFIVDSKGLPQDVQMVQASDPVFGEAAAEAVKQWRFHPGYKGGRAVSTRLSVPIVFQLREAREDWF